MKAQVYFAWLLQSSIIQLKKKKKKSLLKGKKSIYFIRFLLNKAEGGGWLFCLWGGFCCHYFCSLVATFLKIGVLVIPAVILQMHVVVGFFNVILKNYQNVWILPDKHKSRTLICDWILAAVPMKAGKEMTHIFVWAFLSYDWSKNR